MVYSVNHTCPGPWDRLNSQPGNEFELAEMQAAATPSSARPPIRYSLARALNLFLVKRLGFSRESGLSAGRAVNIALAPFASGPRRRIARSLAAEATAPIRIDPEEGYAFPDLAAMSELAPAIEQGRAATRAAMQANELKLYDNGMSRKQFLVYAMPGSEIAKCDAIMRLALARPILDAVSVYLGAVPVLNSVDLMVSLPNSSEFGSQLYHLDFADDRQVKLFICIEPVTPAHGPFTFVPAGKTRQIVEALDYDRGRLTIEQVTTVIDERDQIAVTGDAGFAVMVDTSRCLHYGSRHNREPRVMLVAQYSDYHVPEQPPVRWSVNEITRRLDLDPVQRLALTV